MTLKIARFNMIEQQIRPWNVLNHGLLELLGKVRREDFVPTAYKEMAFMDIEIPLGGVGQSNGQSMLAPRLEARLVQSLELEASHKVLEIGAGSGFMAALLGHLAHRVVSLENNTELVAFANANLRRAGLTNVTVREVDGAKGLSGEADFDAILLSGSVAAVPQVLLDQLKVGGHLVAVVGDEPIMRAVRYTRDGEKAWRADDLFDTIAPRLSGFDESPRFQF